MSNVIEFRLRHIDYIAIDRGTCEGEVVYWLDFIEADGGANIVWSGSSYADALRAADEWARDGIRVVDKTGGCL
jgi:hypothetical protein